MKSPNKNRDVCIVLTFIALGCFILARAFVNSNVFYPFTIGGVILLIVTIGLIIEGRKRN